MQPEIPRLIESSKKGNQLAQLALYNTYAKAMYATACRFVKDKELAKEVMQDAFLKAFLKLDDYSAKATFGAWLKRIVINQCIDLLRKQQHIFTDISMETLSIVEDDNWDFDSSISKQQIITAINQLKPKYKIVLTLYLIEGYDHQEISTILKLSVSASKTQLSRGKQQLRQVLKSNHNETRY